MKLFGFNIPFTKSAGVESPYDSSASSRRLKGWNPSSQSQSSLIFSNSRLLRDRSRDMVRKNPYAKKILDTLTSNIVGKGIRPQIITPDLKFKSDLLDLWEEWTTKADVTGNSCFYGLQNIACRGMIESGESFGRFVYTDNNSIPLQIQLFEPDQLNTSLTVEFQDGSEIVEGIKFDGFGRKVAYNFYKRPPTSIFDSRIESVSIPADEIFHLFRSERIGQNRGLPWMTQVLVTLMDLDKYEDAELVRKQTAALFAAFITSPNSQSSTIPGVYETETKGIGEVALEPGTIQILEEGEDVKFSSPTDLGDSYKEFIRNQLQRVASGAGVLYEQLTGDLRSVNYSSIRAGLIEFRRMVEQYQSNLLIHQMCRPTWNKFIASVVLSDKISIPSKFLKNPEKFLKVKWVGQGHEWVDPLKDVQADKIAVRCGFKSREEVISEYGSDIDTINDQIERDNKILDDKGIVLEVDPRKDIGVPSENQPPATTDQKVIENDRKKNG